MTTLARDAESTITHNEASSTWRELPGAVSRVTTVVVSRIQSVESSSGGVREKQMWLEGVRGVRFGGGRTGNLNSRARKRRLDNKLDVNQRFLTVKDPTELVRR